MSQETRIEKQGGRLRLLPTENAPKQQGKLAAKQLVAALDDLADQWDRKNAAQKQEALRQMLIIQGRILRGLTEK